MSGKVSKKSSKTSSTSAQETLNTAAAEAVESPVAVAETAPTKTNPKKTTKKTTVSKAVADPEPAAVESAPKQSKKTNKKAPVPSPVESETSEVEAEPEEPKPAKKATKAKAGKTTKVVDTPVEEDMELVPKTKKVVVEKPEVVVLSSKTAKTSSRSGKVAAKSPAKKAAKSPAKKAAKSPAKKSPAKKSQKKSPKSPRTAKKATTKTPAKKAGGRRVAGKKGKKSKAKENKPRREHNLKATVIDESGIGIGPARVKKVLVHDALNPLEHKVRMEIRKAENKPVRPKPTDEDRNPAMPAQGPQVHVDNLNPRVLEVIRRAEAAHFQSLNDEYERSVLKEMDEDTRKEYDTKRKAAAVDKNTFDLKAFNLSYDKNFYTGFPAFCNEHDSYQLGRKSKNAKTGVEREKYNEWSRAAALVNKLGIRLSNETRTILACYLDNLVIQYARNGIHNCIKEKLSIVQLRHALTPSEGFDDRVPLDAFARTLDGYQLALNWLEICREIREEVRKHKAEGDEVESSLPEYPEPVNQTEDFQGYVVEICRSVRIMLAQEQKVTATKNLYLNTSISKPFKKFCSIIVYEAIKRVGSILKEAVSLTGVKTVSDQLMYHALRQIHNVCGIDFEPVAEDMEVRLARFKKWRSARRQARKDKKEEEGAKGTKETKDADDEDEDEEEEDDDHLPAPDAEEEEAEEEEEEEAEEEEKPEAEEVEEEVEEEEDVDENEAEAEAEEEEDAAVEVDYEESS